MKIKALVAGVALVAVGGQAMAATDGTYGTTSQGSAIITATVGNMLRVSAIQDVTLTLGGGWVGTGNACVFNNVGSAYNVTLTTANPTATAGEFSLVGGPSGPQVYTVNWNGVAASSGVPQGSTGASQVADCGAPGNTNATYTVSAAGSMGSAANGVYSDTLTILVSP